VARTGPIVIGYDGTSASRPAIDETVALFARRKALVVVCGGQAAHSNWICSVVIVRESSES
jgi:hypothetical protein